MSLTPELSGQIKSALLDCEAKSEQLEEAARQLTVQKLRCQLAIETRLGSLSRQLQAAGQKLLAELGSHHDTWQAKLHKEEHMLLKHSMQLSSALAKETITPTLVTRLEEKLTVDLAGLNEVQFQPSPGLDSIVKSDVGFLQLGLGLPSHWVLSLDTLDKHKVSCLLSTTRTGHTDSPTQFLVVMVERVGDALEVEYQLRVNENNKTIQVIFVLDPEFKGKYRVIVTMYGEMVTGSPLIVEIREDGKDSYFLENPREQTRISSVKVNDEFETGSYVENTTDEDFKNIKSDDDNIKQEDEAAREVPTVAREITGLQSGTPGSGGDMEITNNVQEEEDEYVHCEIATDAADVALSSYSESPNIAGNIIPTSTHQHDSDMMERLKFPPGTDCIALWSEDSVWYRAKVDSVVEDLFHVTFRDYGNSVSVKKDQLVATAEDIPTDQLEMVDHMVWEGADLSTKWPVGMCCIARWSADYTWYNGVVTDVNGGQCTVLFTDYGNEEVVSEDSMVEVAGDIPAGESIDIHVVREDDASEKSVENECSVGCEDGSNVVVSNKIVDISDGGVTPQDLSQDQNVPEQESDKLVIPADTSSSDSAVLSSTSAVVSNLTSVRTIEVITNCTSPAVDITKTTDPAVDITTSRDPSVDSPVNKDFPIGKPSRLDVVDSKYEVGNYCIAEWTQDGTWYNGLIVEINTDMSCMVEFVDYGNVEVVAMDKIVDQVDDIPTGSCIDQWVSKVELVQTGNAEVIDASICPELEERVEKDDPLREDTFEKEGLTMSKSQSLVSSAMCLSQTSPVIPRPLQADLNIPVSQEQSNSTKLPPAEQIVSLSEQVAGCTDEVADNKVSPGQVCLARWSADMVWYNARVEEVLPGGKDVVVTFTDYGNTDQVPVGQLLQPQDAIPRGEDVDVNVQQPGFSVEVAGFLPDEEQESFSAEGLVIGDECVALWSADNVWYNARILKIDKNARMGEVEFLDYGNIDMVSLENIFRTLTSVQEHRPGEEITVDPNVETGQQTNGGEDNQVLMMSLVSKDQYGKRVLPAVVVNTISVAEGMVGMTVLHDGSLVIAVEAENTVKIWSREGELRMLVVGGRQFNKPADVVSLGAEGFAVRDRNGIMVFDVHGLFRKELIVDKLDTFSGLTVDCLGRLVTVNRCLDGDTGKLTEKGETDILYVDVEKEKVVKRVEMVDIIADRAKTECKALTMYRDKLYVVDTGLDCIYTLFHEDGEDQAEVFGMPGRQEAQFSGVTSVVVDDESCMVVSDTRNNRLQLIDDEWEFVGFVKVVPRPLSKPTMMCLDREVGQLVVHNMGNREVVRYQLGVKD